jgi:sirohydrochlorin ferrochelatase
MMNPEKEAIILFGHGSRIPGAGEGMEQVAARIRDKLGPGIIEICYMSRLGPHFPEIFESCVARGATKIIVMPYFLHSGLHLMEDIPDLLRDKAGKYPHVKLVLGKNLGFDECIVDLVIKRLGESKNLPDIRELKPPADNYRRPNE